MAENIKIDVPISLQLLNPSDQQIELCTVVVGQYRTKRSGPMCQGLVSW